jgi:hypothetical protein
MPSRYLLDEHLRGLLWHAVQQHNARGVDPIDVLRVGDPPDLPLGSIDPDILVWAEREGRVVLTFDRRTMPVHLTNHLKAGRHSPGVFVIRPLFPLPQVVDELALHAHAGDPLAYQDRVTFIP